jgi:hypothetical protein
MELAPMSVRVRADFERKCFDIHFQLVQSIYDQLKSLLGDDRVATAKTILEWIGLIGGTTGLGLLGFLKVRRGRNIEEAVKIDAPDGSAVYNIRLEGDHNSITLSEPVFKLASSPKIAKATREIVRPLATAGIDKIEIRDDHGTVDEINKKEANSFYAPPISLETGLSSQVIDAILTLRAPVFVPGAKWQFFFGEMRLSADITDNRFLAKVFVDGERFGAGDKILVKMRISQHQTTTGQIRNDYEVMDVLNIWPSGNQISLPMDSEDEPPSLAIEDLEG